MKPLFHFLVLGALLFAAKQWLPEPERPREAVRIAAADVQSLRAQWPDEAQFQSALERHVREEVLVSEALRLGLDRRDPVVRWRLLANMRFAFPGSQRDDALLRDAAALGMARRDVVVRRRLIQVLEQRLAQGREPGEAELAHYIETQLLEQGGGERISFRHVFVEPANAAAALEQLRGGAEIQGEAFALGNDFSNQSLQQIERRFGTEFARVLGSGARGEWLGPFESAYGQHLVRIEERTAPAPADPAVLRQPMAYALNHEQRRRRTGEAAAALRAAYRVELP